MDVEEIVSEMKSEGGDFPREALLEAAGCREAIAPALLEIVEETTENYESLIGRHDYSAHIYAIYLLAQFRDYRAYPLITKFCAIPQEALDDLTGDFIYDDLHRILASVSCGDDRLIKGLIEDETASEYVRAQAISSLVTLVACGEKSRKEVVDYFQDLFRGKLKREPSLVWSSLVDACEDLYPEEVKADIEQAFAEELADIHFSNLEDLQYALKKGKSDALSELRESIMYSLIVDPVEDLDPRNFYHDEPTDDLEFDESKSEDAIERPHADAFPPIEEKQPELKPVGRKADKIGRNEPCPCGSGKKYKKCCGRVLD
jgi:hypothetical protein